MVRLVHQRCSPRNLWGLVLDETQLTIGLLEASFVSGPWHFEPDDVPAIRSGQHLQNSLLQPFGKYYHYTCYYFYS